MAVKFYTVKRGDTLTGIGQRFGVPVQQLAQFNKKADPNKLAVSEVLMIPAPDSEEDRMRVQAAKQAPAAEQVRAQRPSQQPSSGFEVVERPRAQPPREPLPASAEALVQGPQPVREGGSLENVHAKSYPPHDPRQLAYPEFWADFLDKALPTAMAGATGPGAGLLRGAVALGRMENPFQPEPSAARADFARKAGRHFQRYPDEPRDPNYGQVFEPDLGGGRRAAPEEIKDWNFYRRYRTDAQAPAPFPRKGAQPAADAGPGPADFVDRIVNDFLGINYPVGLGRLRGAQVADTRHNLARLSDEAAQSVGPRSSHPKNVFRNTTTAEKNVSPFRAAASSSHPKSMIEPGNIDLHHRPVVHNADGTISTVRSMSIGTDQGEVLIPTISEDGRVMTADEAIKQYRKTGRHLGIFRDRAAADAFAKQLHQEQEQEYSR